MKKALVPELRFPEFRDAGEWEIKPLGKTGRNLDSKRVPITGKDRIKGNTPYYGASGIIDYVQDYIYNEDLLCISEDGANLVDRTYPIAFSITGKTWVNNHAHVMKFENTSIQIIIENYLNSISLVDYLTGMAQPKLNRAKLDIIPIPLPEPKEQQKIADCLSSLDGLITAHTQKHEALKAHKKGLMQQLFPAEGETVPTLRFPEFRDAEEWDEKQLTDVCGMQAGKFVRASDIHDKKEESLHPCYGGNGLRGFTKTYTHSGNYSLIGRQGALCGNVTFATDKFHATEHAVVVTPKKGLKTDWIFYKLIHLNLNQYATGQAQPGLSVDNLEKVAVEVPTTENEQKKIADFLSSIDELITAQSQKIEVLKTHKKGLMQQLFPATGEAFS